ncbi:hypothetical protein GP486_007913, partial [Trichoglossum hirsutum]
QSLETVLAERGDLDVRSGDDAGRSGSVVQQGEFAKVIALLVSSDGCGLADLVAIGLAGFHDEEGFARVPFLDDRLAGGEALGLESIGDLGPLVQVERGEQGNLPKEALVHPSTLKGVLHQDAAEGDPVERPETRTGLCRYDGSRSGGIVHESQLAKGTPRPDGRHLVAHAVGSGLEGPAGVDVDVKTTLLDNVKVVPDIPLRYDLYVLGRDRLLH